MRTTLKQTECMECGSEAETRAGHCKRCHALILGRTVVLAVWSQTELPDLVDTLRESQTIGRFLGMSKDRNAHRCVTVGHMLLRLVHLSGLSDGDFTRSLCSRFVRDGLELESLSKIPGGIEEWKRRTDLALGEAVARLRDAGRKSKLN